MKSCLSVIGLNSWANRVLQVVRSSPISCRVPPGFSSSIFSVLGFRFTFLIHLRLVFVQSDKYRPNFTLLHVNIQFCWKYYLFSKVYVWHTLVKKQVEVTWTYIWIFNSIPLICVSVCLGVHTMLFILSWLCSITWNWLWWYLLWNSALGTQDFLCSHVNLRTIFLFLYRMALKFWFGCPCF